MAGERLALIVAVDEYRDKALKGLASPAADASALAEILGDPDRGGFDVEISSNDGSSAIAERVEALLVDRKRDDLVLLHFSCHGIKDATGDLYLAAANTQPGRLASTAVDAAMVSRLMRRSRAQRVVLLLDCCYGGAFEHGFVARATGDVDVGEQFQQQDIGGGRGRVVITASSAMEYAFESGALTEGGQPRPSYFTGALVEGIRTGRADRDNDGRVALGELYEYIYERVREQSPRQTPGKWEFGTNGELVISRNPGLIVDRRMLPDDLVELLENPRPAARFGSVQELLDLAGSSRLGVALAAVDGLRALRGDDSKRVAAAAMEALDAIAPQLSHRVLDLGTAIVGEKAPTTEFTVTGPPLTEFFTVTSTPSAVVARKNGRTVTVTVDTSAAGVIAGDVSLLGPAVDLQVPVGASIQPAKKPVVELPPRPSADAVHSTDPGTGASPPTGPAIQPLLSRAPVSQPSASHPPAATGPQLAGPQSSGPRTVGSPAQARSGAHLQPQSGAQAWQTRSDLAPSQHRTPQQAQPRVEQPRTPQAPARIEQPLTPSTQPRVERPRTSASGSSPMMGAGVHDPGLFTHHTGPTGLRASAAPPPAPARQGGRPPGPPPVSGPQPVVTRPRRGPRRSVLLLLLVGTFVTIAIGTWGIVSGRGLGWGPTTGSSVSPPDSSSEGLADSSSARPSNAAAVFNSLGIDRKQFPCEAYIVQLASTGATDTEEGFAAEIQKLDKARLPDRVHYANTSDTTSVDPKNGVPCAFYEDGGQWVLYADSFAGLDDACRTRLDRSPTGAIVKATTTYDDRHGISCLCPDSVNPPSLRPDPNPDPWVAELQSALANVMNASITGDEDNREYFGAQTQNAVKDFQEKHTITGEDGFVGPKTWAGLKAAVLPSCDR